MQWHLQEAKTAFNTTVGAVHTGDQAHVLWDSWGESDISSVQ